VRFKVVVTGRDCFDAHVACLESLRDQVDDRVDVCVIDDASEYKAQRWLSMTQSSLHGWLFGANEERLGAMHSQIIAIEALDPQPEDVIVWLDGDDRFNPEYRVFDVLERYYSSGVLMTYGSYITDPADAKCSPARRYPPQCVRENDYRNFTSYGLRFNHLRTVSARLFLELDESEFQHADGAWFMGGCDAAVMIPCLELAGGRYARILEPLHVYTSNNPQSDWRVNAREVRRVHDRIAASPRRDPL
jgi:glycosyltransferase involved in cell wall biosynthesis